jgi:hypothetical protein
MTNAARRQDLLTPIEAAAYLGMSRGWLAGPEHLRPRKTRFGSKVFYLQSDLDEFVEMSRERRGLECLSISEQEVNSGGANSKSAGQQYGAAQAKQLAAKLRELSANTDSQPSEPTLGPKTRG